MSRKSLEDNAPGETRTPNLLIRSQFFGFGPRHPTGEIEQVPDTGGIRYDRASHNISHNTGRAA